MKRHIALVGFMAAGKSTIGKKLARELGCAFYDTDDLVVDEHGQISDIFYEEGEPAFRRYEHAAIAHIIDELDPGILALGGGAVTYEATQTLLKKKSYRIFIKVSPEQVHERLKQSKRVRPLIGPTPSLSRIRELYAKRMPLYAHADLVVEADILSTKQAVETIVEWLHKKKIKI